MTDAERFFAKVNKTESCWVWTGCRQKLPGHEYGFFSLGKFMSAHRASWILHFGPIPDGLCVLHTCDNPSCVRPDHLFLGTRKNNSEDCRKKQREARGEGHGLSKLTDDDVRQIRALYVPGRNSGVGKLARRFGVNRTTLHGVVTRRLWAHVQ